MSRYVRLLVRKFWGICAILLIATAVLVQLGREFSPLVDNYRGAFSEYLSGKLGVRVSIGRLSGRWSGLRPELRIHDLRLNSTEGVPVLSIEHATAQLSLLNSLLEWRLSWGQLLFSGIDMAFEQDAGGDWAMVGLSTTTAAPNTARVVADDPLDVFLLGRHVELKEARLSFMFRSGHRTRVQVPHILLENDVGFHRLITRLSLDEQEDTVLFVLEGRGDPRERQSFEARGYLKLQRFPVQKVLAALPGERWRNLSTEWREGSALDLTLWLTSEKGSTGFSFQGQFDLEGVLEAEPAEAPEVAMDIPRHISSSLTGHWLPAEGWRLAFQNASFNWQDGQTPAFNLVVEHGPERRPTLTSDRIELAPWLDLARRHGFLSGRAEDILAELNPRGTLHNVQVQLDLAREEPDFKLRANLEKLAVNTWRGAPALQGVDGYIEASRRAGFVDIHSRAGFMMHYPTVYRDPIRHRSMTGQVAWSLRPEDNAIYINSGPLRLRDENETVDGYFHIYLPWEKGSESSNLTLLIGLRNSQVKQHRKYVPFTVPDTLESWLGRSLGVGEVPDGGFLYNGSLAKGNTGGRAIQLYLDVRKASLDYHRDWPGLTDLNGFLTLDDSELNAHVDSARLYDSRLGPTLVAITPNPLGQGGLLGIRGTVSGGAGDGLRVLRESPLREPLDAALDGWKMQGDMQAEITLSIPLVEGEPGLQQQVRVDVVNTSLTLETQRLAFENLRGRVSYSSATGLSAPGLTGRLWQRPVNLSIANPDNPRGGRDIAVSMSGSVGADVLARWSRRPEFLFASGTVNYLAHLHIPSAAAGGDLKSVLNVSSDLQGVAVDLPQPYGKTAQQTLPLQVRVPVSDTQTVYEVRYGELVQALFVERDQQLFNAAIGLGEKAALGSAPALRISGRPERLVLSEWQSVLNLYRRYERDLSGSAGEPGLPQKPLPLKPVFDVQVGNLKVAALELADIDVSGEYLDNYWQLEMRNDTLAGNLLWFHDEARAASLVLDYLRLPASSLGSAGADSGAPAQKAAADPFTNWNPADVMAVDFSTGEFSIGEERYGSWSFKLRPTPLGLVASDLRASVKGATISGSGALPGAEFRWERRDGADISQFRGRVQAKDLAEVMQAWQQPKLLESDSAVFDVEFSWPGSPAALGVKNLSGNLHMKVEEGRFFSNTGTGNNPLLRLIGLFNFDTWARRLELDFSDLIKSGLAYDKISGQMEFDKGLIYLTEPVEVSTPSSRLQMAGTIDIKQELLDATLVATLPVGGNLTLIAAVAAGLPAAASVYVASKIFKKQVDKVASASYRMTGPWSDPKVAFERLFDDKAAKRAGEDTRKEAQANGTTLPEDGGGNN